jgi:esterase/lipase
LENYRIIALIKIDAKIMNKMLANCIQQCIKRILAGRQGREAAQTMYTQVSKCKNDKIRMKEFRQNWVNIKKQLMQTITEKKKSQDHIDRKIFDKIQHPLMIKIYGKNMNFLKMKKSIYRRSTANIV